jgi:hypothetical protein
MPLIMKDCPDRPCPIVVCDHCGAQITDARDGNYHWKMGLKDSDYGSRIYFTHKRCCQAFEAGHSKCFMWAAFELVGLPIRLGDNLALDWKVARRRVDVGLYD